MRQWHVFSTNKPCMLISLSIIIRFSSGLLQWACTNVPSISYYWCKSSFRVYEVVSHAQTMRWHVPTPTSLSVFNRFSSGFLQWARPDTLSIRYYRSITHCPLQSFGLHHGLQNSHTILQIAQLYCLRI